MEGLKRIGKWAFCLAAILAVGPGPAQSETLRVGGTGAATELMRMLGAAFEAHEAGADVEVVAGLGSSGAIEATYDGALDLAVSSRPLKADEAALGLSGAPFARTPYGLVSSYPQPGDIASKDIARFFSSLSSAWPDHTPVRVVLRPLTESDTTLMGRIFPGMAEALETVRGRVDVSVAATDQDNLTMASDIYGSLVGASLAQVVTENRRLQFLSIDGRVPTVDALESGEYPYEKRFYVVLPENPAPLAERFLAFVGSDAGVALLREATCLPIAN